MFSATKLLMKNVSSTSNGNSKRLSANNTNLGIELNNSPNFSYASSKSNENLINYSPTPSSLNSTNHNINTKDLTALELSTQKNYITKYI